MFPNSFFSPSFFAGTFFQPISGAAPAVPTSSWGKFNLLLEANRP